MEDEKYALARRIEEMREKTQNLEWNGMAQTHGMYARRNMPFIGRCCVVEMDCAKLVRLGTFA